MKFITTFASPGTCPYLEPDRTKIRPSPRPYEMFCIIIRWIFDTSSIPQDRGSPPVGCRPLFSQYIRSYSSYLEAVPPTAVWRLAILLWQNPIITALKNTVISNNALNSAFEQNFYCYLRKLAAESRPWNYFVISENLLEDLGLLIFFFFLIFHEEEKKLAGT